MTGSFPSRFCAAKIFVHQKPFHVPLANYHLKGGKQMAGFLQLTSSRTLWKEAAHLQYPGPKSVWALKGLIGILYVALKYIHKWKNW